VLQSRQRDGVCRVAAIIVHLAILAVLVVAAGCGDDSDHVNAPVSTTVVHDVATEDGDVVEDTFDWYAQDTDGTVWYFGEDTKAYEDGEVSTEGSWEAGVAGAQPGIIVTENPQVGDAYRQEFAAGVAEDRAEVLSLTAAVTVPYGSFENCLMTKDFSDLEPGIVEHKVFCPGVGQVSARTVEGGTDYEELVSITYQ
jgi:hypothetical protein